MNTYYNCVKKNTIRKVNHSLSFFFLPSTFRINGQRKLSHSRVAKEVFCMVHS